ncbi:MAG: four helix bundle protein [Acidobacteriaceae bacterium]
MTAASQQDSESASQRGPRTRHFRDLIAWQKSMDLARAAYRLTDDMPQQERFGLTSQIRRSAVSVPSNIAEGHGRLTDRGFAAFLGQARGSLFELQTQIELAATLTYVPQGAGPAGASHERGGRTHHQWPAQDDPSLNRC